MKKILFLFFSAVFIVGDFVLLMLLWRSMTLPGLVVYFFLLPFLIIRMGATLKSAPSLSDLLLIPAMILAWSPTPMCKFIGLLLNLPPVRKKAGHLLLKQATGMYSDSIFKNMHAQSGGQPGGQSGGMGTGGLGSAFFWQSNMGGPEPSGNATDFIPPGGLKRAVGREVDPESSPDKSLPAPGDKPS